MITHWINCHRYGESPIEAQINKISTNTQYLFGKNRKNVRFCNAFNIFPTQCANIVANEQWIEERAGPTGRKSTLDHSLDSSKMHATREPLLAQLIYIYCRENFFYCWTTSLKHHLNAQYGLVRVSSSGQCLTHWKLRNLLGKRNLKEFNKLWAGT